MLPVELRGVLEPREEPLTGSLEADRRQIGSAVQTGCALTVHAVARQAPGRLEQRHSGPAVVLVASTFAGLRERVERLFLRPGEQMPPQHLHLSHVQPERRHHPLAMTGQFLFEIFRRFQARRPADKIRCRSRTGFVLAAMARGAAVSLKQLPAAFDQSEVRAATVAEEYLRRNRLQRKRRLVRPVEMHFGCVGRFLVRDFKRLESEPDIEWRALHPGRLIDTAFEDFPAIDFD